jgi:hypothetical protein
MPTLLDNVLLSTNTVVLFVDLKTHTGRCRWCRKLNADLYILTYNCHSVSFTVLCECDNCFKPGDYDNFQKITPDDVKKISIHNYLLELNGLLIKIFELDVSDDIIVDIIKKRYNEFVIKEIL